VPVPLAGHGQVLIQTRASLISAGTERMLVEFSQANLLQKARSQPDKVKQVLDKIKTDGLMPTLEAVFSRIDEPLRLGRGQAVWACCSNRYSSTSLGMTPFTRSNSPRRCHAELGLPRRSLARRRAEASRGRRSSDLGNTPVCL